MSARVQNSHLLANSILKAAIVESRVRKELYHAMYYGIVLIPPRSYHEHSLRFSYPTISYISAFSVENHFRFVLWHVYRLSAPERLWLSRPGVCPSIHRDWTSVRGASTSWILRGSGNLLKSVGYIPLSEILLKKPKQPCNKPSDTSHWWKIILMCLKF